MRLLRPPIRCPSRGNHRVLSGDVGAFENDAAVSVGGMERHRHLVAGMQRHAGTVNGGLEGPLPDNAGGVRRRGLVIPFNRLAVW